MGIDLGVPHLAASVATKTTPPRWASLQEWSRRAGLVLAGHVVVIVGLGVLAVVAMSLWVAVRWRRGARISGRRLRVVMVPTESFNPSVEVVVRFATMVAGTRTPVPLLTGTARRAVRVRLVSKAGDLAYCLEVPGWMASAVRSALPEEVELYPLDVLHDEPAASYPERRATGSNNLGGSTAIRPESSSGRAATGGASTAENFPPAGPTPDGRGVDAEELEAGEDIVVVP